MWPAKLKFADSLAWACWNMIDLELDRIRFQPSWNQIDYNWNLIESTIGLRSNLMDFDRIGIRSNWNLIELEFNTQVLNAALLKYLTMSLILDTTFPFSLKSLKSKFIIRQLKSKDIQVQIPISYFKIWQKTACQKYL